MKKIAVLVSGGGTNLQALINAQQNGILKSGRIVSVVSSRPGVGALERAEKFGIPWVVLPSKDSDYSNKLLTHLIENSIDIIVLAGFLPVLDCKIIEAFPNRIINVHPSLIPSFCGKGYYGLRVHEAVISYGVKLTGATVHFVNNEVDGGPIVMQKAIGVLDDDTPQQLQKRVMEQAEWDILPKACEMVCSGMYEILGRKVLLPPCGKE